ncbi:VOC family protein [Brevibacillus sp. GCM10020057]|uniref:VOC family protein n=1 Tax=Brevibacillus sp. GCM10020057 TaxID=3317327 RepID=UPI00362B8F83
MAKKRIDHVGLAVKDFEGAIEFYQKIVGFELKGKMTHTNGVIQLAFLGFGGSDETELEIIHGYNDALPAEGKVHHFAVNVDNLEEEYERVKSLGATFVDPEIVTLPNGYRYFFIYGPEGEWVEFFQR